MKTYKDHVTSTTSFRKKIIRKPVYRSSAIFPFILSKKLNTNIHFLGYWLIKRDIKEVKVLVTIRNKKGKIFKQFKKCITQVKSYIINLKKEVNFDLFNNLFVGSIELEVFSKYDMVYPYPAFVINFDGLNNSSAVHTCGRVYNDIDDANSNNKFIVPETGFDIVANEKFSPFFSFVNGKKELKNFKILLKFINSYGQEKSKILKFKKLATYETCFNLFLNKKDRVFFNNKKGTVKIHHNFKSFFPRFLAGSFDKKKYDSSITHTYYDLSAKQDRSQYWKNPNPKRYYDSSVAVPLLIKENMKTELAVYPNFSKSKFKLNLEVFDQSGKEIGKIKNFLKVNENFNFIKHLNINHIIESNKINLKKNRNYFCRIYTTYENKILTRLKFGLNIGKIKECKDSFESNICFNAQVPIGSIENKKSTFKWGLLLNKNNSQILISNLSYLKTKYKKANLNLKFWNNYNNDFIKKKITIPGNGNYFFNLNKQKKIKDFLKKNSGWMTIESDNPFINGWYLDISKNGSVGADHLF